LRNKEKSERLSASLASHALQRMGPQGVRAFIVVLKDKDPDIRLEATSGLRGMAVRNQSGLGLAAVPLIDALRGDNAGVRQGAFVALASIGKPALEPLIVALKDKDPKLRREVAGTLRSMAIGKQAGVSMALAVAPLIGALRDDNADVRQEASFALSSIDQPA